MGCKEDSKGGGGGEGGQEEVRALTWDTAMTVIAIHAAVKV